MSGVFAGVRVIELAQFVYVPAAAVLLADQGAEVIKIETIDGDPYRTLQVGASRNLGSVNISMEQNNRNKKSVALDLKSEEGREALLKLVETADVFVTSLRPKAIQALRLDVEDLRAHNPKIIYARGNGVGFRGAEVNRPGYDGSVFWARGGNCYVYTRPGAEPTSPRAAYGDHTGSIALAFGIASALFKRAVTGETSVVENSLLSTSCWVLSGDLTQAQLPAYQTHPEVPIRRPLTFSYACRDGKRVQLMILNPKPRWAALCHILGLEEIVDDPRFVTAGVGNADPEPLIALLAEKFAQKDYAEWRPLLESIDIPWEPVNSIVDVVADPQIHVNGMMQQMEVGGQAINIIAGPVAFDGEPIAGTPRRSPEMGAHTEELLREVGYSGDGIAQLRERRLAR